MRYRGLVLCFLINSVVFAETFDQVQGLETIVHEFVKADVSAAEWNVFVKSCRGELSARSIKEDAKDKVKSYLDERIAQFANDARGGEIEKLKKLARWLALYEEFSIRLPGCVHQFASDRWNEFEDARRNGPTWDRLGAIALEKHYVAELETEQPRMFSVSFEMPVRH